MANRNVQIPNLPQAVGLTGAEQLEIVQGGTSARTTVDQIAVYAGAVDLPVDELLRTTTGMTDVVGFNPANLLRRGIKGFVFPEDFLFDGDTDYSDAIERAQAYGYPLGYALTLSNGDYEIVRPILLEDENHLIIYPGATLEAATVGFSGNALVIAGDNVNPFASERWSITGGGEMQCNNVIDYGIYAEWSAFARIHDLRISGANVSGVFVGQTGTAYSSIETDIRDVWVFYNNVANSASSIGIHINNATDCHIDTCYVIGYRTGIRTEAVCGSIDISNCHVWNRPVHGPLLRCYDIQGKGNSLVQCYADNPTVYNNGGAMASDCYGFFLHGFNPMMIGCHIFMNTGQTPDTSNDNTITAIYMDREVFGAIDGFFIDGGVDGTKRYKSYFSGGTNQTTFQNVLQPGTARVVDTASNIIVMSPASGATNYHRAAAIYTASNRFQSTFVVENTAGVEIRQTVSNADVALQRTDGTGAWTIRKDSSHNFQLVRRDAAGAFVDNALVVSNSTGVVTITDGFFATAASSISGAAATSRDLNFSTSGVRRWVERTSNAAESGANAGSNFQIDAYDDAGAYLSTPFQILRANGQILMSVLQASTSYANDAAAAGGGVPIGGLYRNGSVVQIRIV